MKSLIVLYDNWCPNCIKFSSFIKKHDKFDLIKFMPLRDKNIYKQYPNLNIIIAKNEMASWDDGWYYGFNSIFYVLLRIPIFWIFLPILFF
jgi:predicted DCC family thiol-disulfide oxidoreductase YuxK